MSGLTKETFLALRQMCKAITGLAKFLIDSCGFSFVLLGKIQSDSIEGRFGHIRQLVVPIILFPCDSCWKVTASCAPFPF